MVKGYTGIEIRVISDEMECHCLAPMVNVNKCRQKVLQMFKKLCHSPVRKGFCYLGHIPGIRERIADYEMTICRPLPFPEIITIT